jgi:tetratricopeptide (TPR) repeat protein
MLRQCLFLFLTVAVAWPVPQASSKAELKRLARFPKVEFAPPLHFDRRSGFIVFPDLPTATTAATEILADVKGEPSEASKFLEVGRLLEAHGDFSLALKYCARAADLYRKAIELEPNSAGDLAGLAQALASLGRGIEAETYLQKALSVSREKLETQLAVAFVYQERAWQSVAGNERLFSGSTFLENMAELLADPPEPVRILEAQRFLGLAQTAVERSAGNTNAPAKAQWQRATFLSFQAAMTELFRQTQASESKMVEIRKKLFNESAIAALRSAAKRESGDPAILTATLFASILGDTYRLNGSDNLFLESVWPRLTPTARAEVRQYCGILESIAESGSEESAAAAEFLGCVQIYVLHDFSGARRSFSQAVLRHPRRHRSWDLLVFASAMTKDPEDLLETCQSRFDSIPDARSSVFLAKAYDRNSDSARAELTCLAALAVHQNDFLLNLSLAALLLKRDNAEDSLWRVPDLIKKAEKQVFTGSSAQKRLDFALLKSIFLGLSNKPAEARAALEPFANGRTPPTEIQEILRVLGR